MSGNFTEILVETDVLIQHLSCGRDEESTLESLMSKFNCFTTAINASEIYFHCESEEEKMAADKLLNSLKVLGISSRYALLMFGMSEKTTNVRTGIIAATAERNKLPVVTWDTGSYKNLKSGVFAPNELRG